MARRTTTGVAKNVSFDGTKTTARERWHYGRAAEDLGIFMGAKVTVGPHQLWQHDLESGPSPIPKPKLVWVDPPYSAGLASGYRTKAGVGGKANFLFLIAAICDVAQGSQIIMEGSASPKNQEAFTEIMGRLTYDIVERWDVTFYGKDKASLWHLVPTGDDPWSMPDFTGADDADIPNLTFAHLLQKGLLSPGDLVADPCTGRGLAAVSAASNGLTFAGTELSPMRLAVTVKKLVELTGLDPIIHYKGDD